MAYTTFVNGTVIQPAWLNDVNSITYNSSISIANFMTATQISDRSQDCSDAVQAAVDYAMDAARNGYTPIIDVPFLLKIVTPVNIDRSTDTMNSDLIFRGIGSLGGFWCSTSINLFSSTIAHTSAPVSERVLFQGIHFECTDHALVANVLNGDKFFRVGFDRCVFYRIAAAQCTNYAQSWRFTNCLTKSWKNFFFSSKGMYDVHATLCQWEAATSTVGKGFSQYDATSTQVTAGCSFSHNLFEGCAGPFLSLADAQGVEVSGNYCESNTNRSYDFNEGTTNGISFTGNYVASSVTNQADSNFYEVQIGDCVGFSGSGNHCVGRLYDFNGTTTGGTIGSGDKATLDLYRGTPPLVLSGNGASGITFPIAQVSNSDVNTLDDYEEKSTADWNPTIADMVNCSLAVATVREMTKIGRLVSLELGGTITVTTGTTQVSFSFTLPYNASSASNVSTGAARLVSGSGTVSNSGASASKFFFVIPADQVVSSGAGQSWSAAISYNAAT